MKHLLEDWKQRIDCLKRQNDLMAQGKVVTGSR